MRHAFAFRNAETQREAPASSAEEEELRQFDLWTDEKRVEKLRRRVNALRVQGERALAVMLGANSSAAEFSEESGHSTDSLDSEEAEVLRRGNSPPRKAIKDDALLKQVEQVLAVGGGRSEGGGGGA